jgi:hypothetical protein
MTSESPAPKKAKLESGSIDKNNDNNNKCNNDVDDYDDLLDTLWDHFRNFLDSSNQAEEATADIDELQELVDIGEQHLKRPVIPNDDYDDDDDNGHQTHMGQLILASTKSWHCRQDLLPVLMSVAYFNLAESSISEYLMMQQQQHPQQRQSVASSLLHQENMELTLKTTQEMLTASLRWYPYNANTWSMGANFGRMSQSMSRKHVRCWFERAALAASVLRTRALELLDNSIPEDCKEWIEVLLLHQMVGSEYEGEEKDSKNANSDDDKEESFENEYNNDKEDDDDDEDDNHARDESFENEYSGKCSQDEDDNDENDKGAKECETKKNNESFQNEFIEEEEEESVFDNNLANEKSFQNEYCEKDGEDEEDNSDEGSNGNFSASVVESTARFMCSMLWSMSGRHDRALNHLKHFPLTHRLHPNVWEICSILPDTPAPETPPLLFQPEDGVLPSQLYNSMVKLFAPDSPYWFESDYSNRGYFSFFMEHDKSRTPQNLLEDVIVHHLLPCAQQVLNHMKEQGLIRDEEATEIQGFEWWVHTRPIQANLGHNLHFDTDESLLDQEGKVAHPILSSVLYLTEKCWQGIPRNNCFLVFPGNRLHGVLPCSGSEQSDCGSPTDKKLPSTQVLLGSWRTPCTSETSLPHRLSFMVGFWTRSVPASMKNRRLYGPCGPLPPSTKEHTWVKEIQKGYEKEHDLQRSNTPKTMVASALPCVSPAWESFEGGKGNDDSSPALCIPHNIDHRFFVRDAPQCFRQSLFEDRELDGKL